MGEELIGEIYSIGPDSKKYKWDGLTDAEFISLESWTKDNICDRYSKFPVSWPTEFTVNGNITREGFYTFTVSPNRRMIRRAMRWEEKLRRQGVPANMRRLIAAERARYGANNKKKPTKIVFTVTVR